MTSGARPSGPRPSAPPAPSAPGGLDGDGGTESPALDAVTRASEGTLRALCEKVGAGRLRLPLTEVGLKSEGLGRLAPALPVLNTLSQDGIGAVVELVLAERRRAQAQGTRLNLVWTGPDGTHSTARDTWVVFRELMESARRHVLIAGFRFDHGEALLEPLHANMKSHGVTTQIFLDVPPARADVPVEEHARRCVDEFLLENWPFGPPCPEFFFDPRTAQPRSRASLHAKCVVVDERLTLIGSANFTDRGQSRNIELGVLIEGAAFAVETVAHWQGVLRSGLVRQA